MHGMHRPVVLHGAHSRDQGLGQHLAAEDPLVRLPLRRTHEDILVSPGTFKLTKIQQFDQRSGGVIGG